MILTLLRIGWINLRRDRVVQMLTFVLPIVFFSIFAMVFGNQRDPTRRVNVAVVDEDQSDFSTRLVTALQAEGGLQVWLRATKDATTGALLTHDTAEGLVKSGSVPVAIILPKGLGATRHLLSAGGDATSTRVQVLADVSDPIAPQMVQGLLQKVSFTAMPDAVALEGMQLFERYGGPLTPQQHQSVDTWLGGAHGPGSAVGANAASNVGLPVDVINVMQQGKGDDRLISFYAAGVGVMFLLFSTSGGGGAMLDEEESGTLGRLLGSRAGMSGVLVGKWLFLTLLGVVQLTVMFVWGAAAFRLPLASHLPGFFVMTIATAAAAAAFGLVLATMSRSRQQLSGFSTLIILTMSAIGGSMFPRFLMSETMQKAGLITFNAWALDGYQKVFWREARVIELWPQVAVLVGLTMVFLLLARRFARRWETL